MVDIVTRLGKGSPLTNAEVDANFTNLAEVSGVTGEPMGHEDRTTSTISFNASTRTFTITPVASSFTVWCKGKKVVVSTAQTVTIPNTTGMYSIYYDANGVLSAKSGYFTFSLEAPTAYVYWNAATGTAPYFGDERHGVVLDWQTHEYLHRTRGAALASGFSASGYVLGGNGSSNSHAQITLEGGTFFDEDMKIIVTATNTPTAGTWEQDLLSPARIPVLYLSGTGWVIDAPTDYPLKQGTARPQYNAYSGGVWSTADVANNKYATSWILATNNLTYPVIAIIGQAENDLQSAAEAVDFTALQLPGFPSVEFRPLYKLIFQCADSCTNAVHASLVSITDIRSIAAAGTAASIVTDHGNLSGLSDDDHPQYIHVDTLRTVSAAVKASFLPSQTSNAGKFLQTDGTATSWQALTSGNVTTALGFTPYNATNPSGYISGISSSDVTTALGFTPYNATNPSGYVTAAGARGAISVTGAGSYDSATGVINIVGGVTSFNTRTGAITLSSADVTTALGFTPYNNTNPSGYITGITSTMVTTALGFTPYNSSNPNGYISSITSANVTTALGFTPYNATNPSGYITSSALSGYLTSASAASTYAPLTGGGASGTWGISISGNATTATTATNQSGGTVNATSITSTGQLVVNYNIATPSNYYNGLQQEIRATSGTAGISLHRSGFSHCGIYHDASNTLKFDMNSGTVTLNASIGTIIGSGNYNSYAPTLTGGGASGTWGINITGTASGETLSTVTGRGASTSTALSLNGQVGIGYNVGRPASLNGSNWAARIGANDVYLVMNSLNETASYGAAIQSMRTSDSASFPLLLNPNGDNVTIRQNSSMGFPLGVNGIIYSNTDVRAPIFYDSNDTNYYVNPASTSYMNSVRYVRGAHAYFERSVGTDVGGMGWHTNDSFYVAGHPGYGPGAGNDVRVYGFGNSLHLGNATYGDVLTVANGYTQGTGSIRAPIFYDSNDTAYYVDPNSSSFLVSVGVAGGGIKMNRGYTSNTIWFNSGTDTNHALWNAYFGNDPITRGGAGSGFDGILWNAYAGIQIRGGSSGAYNLITATPVTGGGDQNSHVIGLYAYNALQLATANGYAYAPNDFRAPIFYDSNDTAYYVNPNGTSNVSGDFIVNQSGSAGIQLKSTTGTQSLWIRTGWNGAPTPSVLFNNVQFQSSGSSGGTFTFYTGNDLAVTIAGDYAQAAGSFRAPIFYDSNDTGYYIDPNSTGNAALRMRGGALFGPNSSWAAYLAVGGNGSWNTAYASVATTNGNLHLDAASGYSTYLNYYAGNNVYFGNGASGGIYAQIASDGSFRSPIFYDYNNTGYYVDPASGSQLSTVNLNAGLGAAADGTGNDPYGFISVTRGTGANYSYYGLTRSGNYVVGMGIDTSNYFWIGGVSSGYNGVRTSNSFFMNVSGDTWSVNSSRAPIFYDSNDTGYYVNPDSTSNINTLNVLGTELVGTSTRYNSEILGVMRTTDGTVSSVPAVLRLSNNGTNRIPKLLMTDNAVIDGIMCMVPNAGGSNSYFSFGFAGYTEQGFLVFQDGRTQSSASSRAPIFYDSDNTAYYVNPNGVTNLGGTNDFPLRVLKTSGVNSGCTLFENQYGDNSWGIVSEFRVGSGSGTDSPSIMFSQGYNTNTWSVGFGYADTGTFRINRDHGRHNSSWGTTLMAMDRSGNVTFSGNVTAYSDERLKTNVKKIDNALDIVRQLDGVTFDYIEDGRAGLGVIAQQVEKVLPMLVSESTSSNGQTYKNVAYGNMVGVLIEAAKEQDREIVDLRTRVAQLESLINKLIGD